MTILHRGRLKTAEQLHDELRELSERDARVMSERDAARRAESRRLNDEARAGREARAAEREREREAERERERQQAEAELREQHRTAYLTANPTATDADFERAWPTIRDELFRERAARSRELVVQAALDTGDYVDLV